MCFGFGPVAGVKMPLALQPIQVTLAVPFLYVWRGPRREADAEAEDSCDAEHCQAFDR
jgi:hypothetical protein